MGRVLIFIYIIAVLLFAGFSRAESIEKQALIDSFSVDMETYALHLKGPLSTECDLPPKPRFEIIDENTLKLVVITEQTENCIEKLDGFYDLVFDVRAQLNKEKIDFNGSTEIKIINMVLKLDDKKFFGEAPKNDFQASGIFVASGQGQYYIVTEEKGQQKAYPLQLPWPLQEEQLLTYQNQQVHVVGFSLEAKIPELDFSVGIPNIPSKYSKREGIWVTSISLAAHP